MSPQPRSLPPSPIAFVDLAAQQSGIRGNIEEAMGRVMDHGHYIMGPEVTELEDGLGIYCNAKHVISCSSGTDALLMFLMAKGIGPGDAVICPAFTFTATPEGIALIGASPVFADVELDTFNLDPEGIEAAIDSARAAGLTPRGIFAVDLFGLPADYDRIEAVADAYNLWVLADAAQSFGASYKDARVGTLATATVTSFFPAKPLGCYGDGGAIFTEDVSLAAELQSLRVHGKGTDKYDNVRVGLNARLDTLQAAILLEKLKIFPDELARRNIVAQIYTETLPASVTPAQLSNHSLSAWAQYSVLVGDGKRDHLSAELKKRGVPTAIYYPKPLHEQTAYRGFPKSQGGLAVAERLPHDILSLPMHPYLTPEQQHYITSAIAEILGQS